MKNNKPILFIALLLLVSSCSLLEPIDENQLGEDRINYDPAFAEGLLLNAYEGLYSQFSFNEVLTDDAVENRNSVFRQMATGEWSATKTQTNRWGQYESILYLNKFLTVIDNVSWKLEDEPNQLLKDRNYGEALAMRALRHFFILQEHAGIGESGDLLGIPYLTDFLEYDADFNIPRLSFEATVEAINKDFDEALLYLPMDYDADINKRPKRYEEYDEETYKYIFGKDHDNRISGRIIKAFQAKLAMLVASPAFLNGANNSYQQAADILGELIEDNSGIGGLEPEGTTNFYAFPEGTRTFPEVLWRGNVGNGYVWIEEQLFPPSFNGTGRINPSQNLVDAFPMVDGYPFSNSHASYNSKNPFENRDPRLKAYIFYHGNDMNGRQLNLGLDGVDRVVNLSTRSGYYLKKLLDETVIISADGTKSASEKMNVYLRYTDFYLLLAEAANEIGGPDYQQNGMSARDIIAAIRKRAGIGLDNGDKYLSEISTKEEMRQLIRNERRLELCFEGHRFYDLRRWGMLDEIPSVTGAAFTGLGFEEFTVETRNYPEYSNYAPIPLSEIIKFDALEQNKGW